MCKNISIKNVIKRTESFIWNNSYNSIAITITPRFIKVGLSPSKKIIFICFNESPLKVMKNTFSFILKTLFVLKIFKFLS